MKTPEQIEEQLADIETTLQSFDEKLVELNERCAAIERDMERADNNLADDVRSLRSDISTLERK